ncbi:hypothetical protein AOLI_G00188900 [Acnodon oligacanthus]
MWPSNQSLCRRRGFPEYGGRRKKKTSEVSSDPTEGSRTCVVEGKSDLRVLQLLVSTSRNDKSQRRRGVDVLSSDKEPDVSPTANCAVLKTRTKGPCLKHLSDLCRDVSRVACESTASLVFSSSPGGYKRRNINKLLGVSAGNLAPVAFTCLLYTA